MINWCLHRGDYLWGTNFAKSDNTSTLSTILAQREGVGVRLVSGGNRFDSSLRFLFCFLNSLCYRHCPVTVPLIMNQTLCAKAFITACHLGDGSVASGTGSWAISKWTERIIRTLTQRQAAVPITPIRNKRSIAPRTIKGFRNQNNVAQFSRKTKTKLALF